MEMGGRPVRKREKHGIPEEQQAHSLPHLCECFLILQKCSCKSSQEMTVKELGCLMT